jgi:cell division protein FtsW
MKRAIRIQDPIILSLGLVLSVIGLFFAFDAGFARSLESGHGVLPGEFTTQMIMFPFALLAGWVVSHIPKAWYQQVTLRLKNSTWIWCGCLLLLVLAIVGPLKHPMNGAERWVGRGMVTFQPAEFCKFGAIVYLSAIFTGRKAWPKKRPSFKNFDQWLGRIAVPKIGRWWPAICVVIGVGLIESEPDMGTGLVILAVGFALAYAGKATRKSLGWGLCLGVIGCVAMLFLQPYRLQRLENHWHRWESNYIDDSGYQSVQSEIAMASGHFFGVGIGAGHAKHLIPAATTDFVMTTVAEEFGFFGTFVVLALLCAFVLRLLYRAKITADPFAKLVLYGFATWLAFQGGVNVLQANATLPPIGIPFPFISTGGSSLIALWMAIGITEALAVKVAPTHAVVGAVVEKEESNAGRGDGRRDGRPRLSGA